MKSINLTQDLAKLYDVRIISDKKVFVCSKALARSIDRARALLQALTITIQPGMILFHSATPNHTLITFLRLRMSETEGNLLKQKKREKKSVEEIIEEYNKGERNFSNFDLRGQSFAGYNLSGANFSNCNLRGADFTGCDLKGTNFRKARLAKAILHDIKAGSENDRTTYTWFFAFLLFAAGLTMTVICLLVFSREGEVDLINKVVSCVMLF